MLRCCSFDVACSSLIQITGRRQTWEISLQFVAVGVAERSRQTTSPPLSRIVIANVVPKKPFAPVTVLFFFSVVPRLQLRETQYYIPRTVRLSRRKSSDTGRAWPPWEGFASRNSRLWTLQSLLLLMVNGVRCPGQFEHKEARGSHSLTRRDGVPST